MENITIYIKERKIYFGVLFVLIILMMSVYEFFHANEAPFNINSTLVKFASVVTFIAFGFIFYYCVKVIIQGRKGFLAGQNGVYDNSSALSIGFIPWKDISYLEAKEFNKIFYLLIYLEDVAKYKSGENEYIGKIIDYNMKFYKAPIVISSKKLKCDILDLEKRLKKLYENSLHARNETNVTQ